MLEKHLGRSGSCGEVDSLIVNCEMRAFSEMNCAYARAWPQPREKLLLIAACHEQATTHIWKGEASARRGKSMEHPYTLFVIRLRFPRSRPKSLATMPQNMPDQVDGTRKSIPINIHKRRKILTAALLTRIKRPSSLSVSSPFLYACYVPAVYHISDMPLVKDTQRRLTFVANRKLVKVSLRWA